MEIAGGKVGATFTAVISLPLPLIMYIYFLDNPHIFELLTQLYFA